MPPVNQQVDQYSADQMPSRPQDAAYLSKTGGVPIDLIEQYDRMNGTHFAALHPGYQDPGDGTDYRAIATQEEKRALGVDKNTTGVQGGDGTTVPDGSIPGIADLNNPTVEEIGSGAPSDTAQQKAARSQWISYKQTHGTLGGADKATNPNGGQRSPNDPVQGSTQQTNQQANDPWAQFAAAYGLGAPPAEGLPAVLQGVDIGAAPQTDANGNDASFLADMYGQGSLIGNAYGYNTPQAATALLDKNGIPQTDASQVRESDQLMRMANGQGYDPAILAKMKADALQSASNTGIQQMSQMKRVLGANGVRGGASAAVQGNIVRQTGQDQQSAVNNIDIQNAGIANENAKFGIGQETQIQQGNMQEANAMALANANRMFAGLQANQNASNTMNQYNTGLQATQKLQGADAQSNFLSQQVQQRQQQRFDINNNNTNLQFQRQNDQAGLDWDKQKSQWQELNNRYGQAANTLGAWGSAA